MKIGMLPRRALEKDEGEERHAAERYRARMLILAVVWVATGIATLVSAPRGHPPRFYTPWLGGAWILLTAALLVIPLAASARISLRDRRQKRSEVDSGLGQGHPRP